MRTNKNKIAIRVNSKQLFSEFIQVVDGHYLNLELRKIAFNNKQMMIII